MKCDDCFEIQHFYKHNAVNLRNYHIDSRFSVRVRYMFALWEVVHYFDKVNNSDFFFILYFMLSKYFYCTSIHYLVADLPEDSENYFRQDNIKHLFLGLNLYYLQFYLKYEEIHFWAKMLKHHVLNVNDH